MGIGGVFAPRSDAIKSAVVQSCFLRSVKSGNFFPLFTECIEFLVAHGWHIFIKQELWEIRTTLDFKNFYYCMSYKNVSVCVVDFGLCYHLFFSVEGVEDG